MSSLSNWIVRLSRAGLGLACVTLLTGCPELHHVEVQMKAGSGGAAEGAAEETEAAAVAGYGNLHGVLTLEGDVPAVKKLFSAGDASVKDSAICAAGDAIDEGLIINPANKGIANAVIFLEKAPATIKPELVEPPKDPAIFDQKACRFFPRVVAFRIGQPLMVLSDDPIPHNTHTDPKRNSTFNQTISPNDRKGVECRYTKPEATPVKVVCDYHAWMKAYHFPVDHPYFAVTDADGKFKIDGLPAGKHTFNVWHEAASGGFLERKVVVEIAVDGDTEKNLSYAPAKFAAVPAPQPAVAYERLRQGGEIQVTQREKQ